MSISREEIVEGLKKIVNPSRVITDEKLSRKTVTIGSESLKVFSVYIHCHYRLLWLRLSRQMRSQRF